MSLDYFALDVGIAKDPRIQQLIRQQGGLSLSVYILLLTRIYASPSGCELQITDEHVTSIAVALRCKTVFVHEVIAAARRIGLFSQKPDPMLLTSPAIRRRYEAMTSAPAPPAQEQPPEPPADTPLQFPPSVDDIQRFLRQCNWDAIISAREFHDYYAAIGWCINGEPIADWRDKAEKWVTRRLNPTQRRKAKAKNAAVQPEPTKKDDTPAISASEFLASQGLNSIADVLGKKPPTSC